MVGRRRIELRTLSLKARCSTTELTAHRVLLYGVRGGLSSITTTFMATFSGLNVFLGPQKGRWLGFCVAIPLQDAAETRHQVRQTG